MTTQTQSTAATRAVAKAHAAIAADDENMQAEWKEIRSPFKALANRTSPETRARRAALFAELERAQALTREKRQNKVLNARGKPQATLAPATTNQLRIDPKKTVEQQAAAAVRSSQMNRPEQRNKRLVQK